MGWFEPLSKMDELKMKSNCGTTSGYFSVALWKTLLNKNVNISI